MYVVSGVPLVEEGVKAALRGVAEGARACETSFVGDEGVCLVDILRNLRASVGLMVRAPSPLILPDFLLSEGVSDRGVFDLVVTFTLTERRCSGCGRSVKVAERGRGCRDLALEDRVGAAKEMSEGAGGTAFATGLRACVLREGVRERLDCSFLSDGGAMGLRVTRAVIPVAGAPGPDWLPRRARTGKTEVEADVCSWFEGMKELVLVLFRLGTEASRWVMVMG